MDIFITVLLVIFATVMLTAEVVFIPGIGITGLLGALAMIGSVFYAFMQISSMAGWITLLVSTLISIALFLWALYGKSIDKVALKKNIKSTVKTVEMSDFAIGDRGVAKTRLALIGEAVIKGRIVEVKSESGFINENEEIEVVRISEDSLFVARVNK